MIYFIQAGETGPVKIGYAAASLRRLANLQVGHYETLTLIREIEGGRGHEDWFHEQFAGLHIRGEWFRFAAPMLTVEAPTSEIIISRSHPLARHRSQRGLTQVQFAALIGDTQANVARYELGRRPPVDTMHKIFEMTEGAVDANDFYGITVAERAPHEAAE